MSQINLEQVASQIHDGWRIYKQAKGVVFGPDRTASTHPHLVDWSQLDEDSRNQDRFIASVIVRDWIRSALSPGDLPAAIHNAWVEWSQLQGEQHPHAKPFYVAHATDPGEHQTQADLIVPLLVQVVHPNPVILRRKCLALLPFREHTIRTFDQVVEPAILQAGYEPVRADRLRSAQSIHEDVVDQIELASAVIADLTDDNPNVNYEIGIARSLGKPIVMLSAARQPDSVPFYYKGQRIHFVDSGAAGWEHMLGTYIQSSLTHAVRMDPLSENQKIGLTGIFRADDSAFEAELKRQIKLTTRQIVAVGWGMAFLNRQRREVMDVVRSQVLREPDLRVHIILARPDHPGLVERIREEDVYQKHTGILTDWHLEFFKFANELPQSLTGEARERVFVRRLPYLPTAMIVRLDDVDYFRCYGPPNSGGWQSPWLRCQRSLCSETWGRFLDNFVQQAVEHCVASDR